MKKRFFVVLLLCLVLSLGSAVNAYAAPAPPLTDLQVYAVWSINSPIYPEYEYFSSSQFSSIHNHGGGEMYIVTYEIGIGSNRIAKMNGQNLTAVRYDPIDLNGDRIIDGWYYYWDASAFENGNFTYQCTSINSPYNTMSDSIYIR